MNPALQALLAQLPPDEQLEFGALLQAIERVRFTGPLLIDFLNGKPRQINLGPPVKLSICAGGSNGGFDTRKPPRTG